MSEKKLMTEEEENGRICSITENVVEIITQTEKKINSKGEKGYFFEVCDDNLPLMFEMQFRLSKFDLILKPYGCTLVEPEKVFQQFFHKEKRSVLYQILYAKDIKDKITRDKQLKKFNKKSKKEKDVTIKKVCNKCDKRVGKMKVCSRCRMVWYCSKECQKVDWKEHKQNCEKRRKKVLV